MIHYIFEVFVSSFSARANICCLLMITFANSLDPDQARHDRTDLAPNCDTDGIPEIIFQKSLV